MLCSFLPYNEVNQPYVYVMLLVSWTSFPPLSPHPIITELPVFYSSFPLAIQCTRDRVYMSMLHPNSSHPPLPSLGSHVCPLHPCFYSCPGNRFICTIFKGAVLFTLLENKCSNLVHCLVLTLIKNQKTQKPN